MTRMQCADFLLDTLRLVLLSKHRAFRGRADVKQKALLQLPVLSALTHSSIRLTRLTHWNRSYVLSRVLPMVVLVRTTSPYPVCTYICAKTTSERILTIIIHVEIPTLQHYM